MFHESKTDGKIIAGQELELVALTETALGEAEIEIALADDLADPGRFGAQPLDGTVLRLTKQCSLSDSCVQRWPTLTN